MNKVVILGNIKTGYSWFCLTHIQGLKINGYNVVEIDYKSTSLHTLKQRLISENPKYIFTHLTFHSKINPTSDILQVYNDVKRVTDCKIIHTMNDARKKDRYMDDISGAIDVAFVGNTECIKVCKKAWNIPIYFSSYSSLHYDKMGKPTKKYMFENPVFGGSPNSHRDRSNFIKSLQKIINIEVFKTKSENDFRKNTLEISASAKCILGLCTGYNINHYIDVRPFQHLGAGAFMIMRKFKKMDDIIPDNLYVPFYSYDDPYVVKTLFDEWKNKDTSKIRKRAFKYIQRHHSCKVRMKNVVNVIEEKQDTTKSFIEEQN